MSDIFTIATLVALFLAVGISIASLIMTYSIFRQTRSSMSYSDLDSMYMEILKMGIDRPEFRDPEKTLSYKTSFSGDELMSYETYAYIVWNFCEAIYDRTHDEENIITWLPVIIAEKRLHYAWIEEPENHHKFKKGFLSYMKSIQTSRSD